MALSINPESNSPFYYDQDLLNNRLTWRLYDGGTLILRGFALSNSSFQIAHTYGPGMGDTIETAVMKKLSDGIRDLSRGSRSFYEHRNEVEVAKDEVMGFVNGIAQGVAGVVSNVSSSAGSLISTASQAVTDAVQNFDIPSEWDKLLRTSKVVTQGMTSKLYEDTSISLPSISSLETIIWTESEKDNCVDLVKKIYQGRFLGEFKRLEYGAGGYWVGPNGINLGEDDATTMNPVSGTFTLHIGPYVFKNLLISKFSWEYSKEFAVVPSGGKAKLTNWPAYARVTVDLDQYKYITDKYLNTTYVPSDAKID